MGKKKAPSLLSTTLSPQCLQRSLRIRPESREYTGSKEGEREVGGKGATWGPSGPCRFSLPKAHPGDTVQEEAPLPSLPCSGHSLCPSPSLAWLDPLGCKFGGAKSLGHVSERHIRKHFLSPGLGKGDWGSGSPIFYRGC